MQQTKQIFSRPDCISFPKDFSWWFFVILLPNIFYATTREQVSTRKSLLVVKGARVFSWDFLGRLFCLRFKRRKKGNILKSRSCRVTNLKNTSALRDWWYQRCLLVCLQRQLWNKEGDRWSRADETRERQQTKVGGRPILTILTSTILNHQLLTTFSFKGFNMLKWLLLLFWYNIPLMLDLSHFNWESATPFFSIPGCSCSK